MQGFSFPLVAEVIEAVCAAGLMIADPVNARGGVGVGRGAPGRSERVRRGRRLVTDEEIVAVVVLVAMVGMVVAGMCSMWFPGWVCARELVALLDPPARLRAKEESSR